MDRKIHGRFCRKLHAGGRLIIESMMNRCLAFALIALAILPSCRTARDVADTSADVVTAPARFVGRRIRGDQEQVYEGQPVDVAPPPVTGAPPPPVRTATPRPRVASESVTPAPAPTQNAAPKATPRPVAQFPVAKPVPGKPGYVFSPYDPGGGYVDVTGYKSGDKMKDPYTDFKKIFVVP